MHHLARQLSPGTVRHLLPRTSKRVVVIGGGPTGLFCADRLRHHFEVTVIDAKEYFEFTPGILRAVVNPAHLSKITFNYQHVLENNLGVEFLHGNASAVEADAQAEDGAAGHVNVRSTAGGKDSQQRLAFDYCVVAVGVCNGVWKPRTPSSDTLAKMSAAPSAGSTAASVAAGIASSLGGAAESPISASGTSPSGSSTGRSSSSTAAFIDERQIETRRRTLRELREQLASARKVIVVGAGLVGVELAGELCHFYPRLKVRLIDGAPTVLPQMAEGARNYARSWLEQRGVKIALGSTFRQDMVGDGDVVMWCVGTRSRTSGLFSDPSVLLSSGQVRVNRKMQVICGDGGKEGSSSSSKPGGSNAPGAPLGNGRVFAVGDVASIEGVPMAQMIFHGEEMAAVAVANIESGEEVASPLTVGKGPREIEAMPVVACTSLGPQDGIFSTQAELVTTGLLAALQKQIIEDTKMGALQGQLLPSLLWMPIH